MFSYLKFWLKSSNQHGLHSPFVYNYLTKGLYETSKLSSNKHLNWILKSICYFKPKRIFVCDELKSNLLEYKLLFSDSIHDAELIFISKQSNRNVESIIEDLNTNQLLFVVNDVYDFSYQKKLRENKNVVLVVDFFVGSLISKRTEQLKQNFFLRL